MNNEPLRAGPKILNRIVVFALGASAGFAVTFLVKHYVPVLWLPWMGSGADIAFALARWHPGMWLLAAFSTVSIVTGQTMLAMVAVAHTAAALGLAFLSVWCALTFLGAFAERNLGRERRE